MKPDNTFSVNGKPLSDYSIQELQELLNLFEGYNKNILRKIAIEIEEAKTVQHNRKFISKIEEIIKKKEIRMKRLLQKDRDRLAYNHGSKFH